MTRKNPNIIKDIEQLMGALGTNNLQKTVYKYTDCGAWIDTETEGQITMGSIVEGVDQCTENYTLKFGKFTLKDFDKALDQIEDEARQIWNETHGCDDCYPDLPQDDMWIGNPVNPECKSCNGYGAII